MAWAAAWVHTAGWAPPGVTPIPILEARDSVKETEKNCSNLPRFVQVLITVSA